MHGPRMGRAWTVHRGARAERGRSALQGRRERADKHLVARYTPNPTLIDFKGTVQGITFRSDGTVLAKPEVHDPKTPRQKATRGRMDPVAEAWGTLLPPELFSWRGYAELVEGSGVRSENGKVLRPYDLFCGLGLKWLQIHPGTAFPKTAPARLFLGDALQIEAEGVEGGVRFRANGPNGPLCETELLLQPLRNAARKPYDDRYRTQGFAAYAGGDLARTIVVPKGAYAAAIRYVLTSTAQASRLIPLGSVVVP